MNSKGKTALIGALIGFFVLYVAVCLGNHGKLYLLPGDDLMFITPGAIVGAIVGMAFGKKESSENVQKQTIEEKKDFTEDLLNYKKLLDAGIITEEEFAKKKDEILKNI